MNIAYFRKSKQSINDTVDAVTKSAKKHGLTIHGETHLKNQATMIVLSQPDWTEKLLALDYQLVGFLPLSITIFQKGEDVLIGSGEGSILKAISHDPRLIEISGEIENTMKKIIHDAAGVTELKPKGVKLYSTTTCPYCTMEKKWLDEKKVKHDVVYVDQDPKEADKMMAKTGQMGVPVTEILFEDAESEYIVGFDKDRLSSILSI